MAVINPAEGLVPELPPGFRFHPMDEEVVSHYLVPKLFNRSFRNGVIVEVDLNKCEPWDLPSKAVMGEKEWYFYCHKDRKYPTGTRTNRATSSGYWKATGKDKEIYRGKNTLVGMKKTLVFYKGRAPRGEKTGWVMHEFRVEGKLPPNLPRTVKDQWVVCKVFNKSLGSKEKPAAAAGSAPALQRSDSLAFLENILECGTSLPALTETAANESSTTAAAGGSIAYPEMLDFKAPNSAAAYPASPYGFAMAPIPQGYAVQNPMLFYPPATNAADQLALLYNGQENQMMFSCAAGNAPVQAIRQYCKAEQYSNQFSPSCETALTTDWNNAEISSVLSRSYGDMDDVFSGDPVMDYTNILD